MIPSYVFPNEEFPKRWRNLSFFVKLWNRLNTSQKYQTKFAKKRIQTSREESYRSILWNRIEILQSSAAKCRIYVRLDLADLSIKWTKHRYVLWKWNFWMYEISFIWYNWPKIGTSISILKMKVFVMFFKAKIKLLMWEKASFFKAAPMS